MSTAVDVANDVFTNNPYEGHSQLSQLESEVLWEYAKLSQHIRILLTRVRHLSEEPDQKLVAQLRVLETKMGLVLTLFKASVWGVINEQPTYDDDNSEVFEGLSEANDTVRQ